MPNQDVYENKDYKLQHVRATRGKMWQGMEARRDAVWVCIESRRLRPTSIMRCCRGNHRLVTGFLNVLFTPRWSNRELYKFVHVTVCKWGPKVLRVEYYHEVIFQTY